MPKQAYHFSLGNSSTGPVGFCARIIASSKEEAVEKLRDATPEEYMIGEYDYDLGVDYLQAYFNPTAVSEKDIDFEEDIEEGDFGYEEEEELEEEAESSCQP